MYKIKATIARSFSSYFILRILMLKRIPSPARQEIMEGIANYQAAQKK